MNRVVSVIGMVCIMAGSLLLGSTVADLFQEGLGTVAIGFIATFLLIIGFSASPGELHEVYK